MSLVEACTWSVVRALLIALASLPIAWPTANLLRSMSARWRGVLLLTMLLPLLMPELLIGFVYSETTLRMVRDLSDPTATIAPPTQLRLPQTMDRPINSADVVAELLYASLLLFRFVPVGAIVLWLMPTPRLSAESIHCRKLLLKQEPAAFKRVCVRADLFVRGPLMAMLPVFAIVFLLSFQEFEIGSLMQISRSPVAWTVWLFDNHAGGLMLSRSLLLSIVPVVCELIVVGIVVGMLMRGDWNQTESLRRSVSQTWFGKAFAVSFLSWAFTFAVGVPACRLAQDISGGIDSLFRQSRLLMDFGQELLISLGFGLASALTAYWLSGFVFNRKRFRRTMTLLLLVPGLIGSLVLSLVALSLFQLPAMNFVYDTPLPMLLVLSLFLIPRAMLLRLVFFGNQPGEPLHLANLMASSGHPRLRYEGQGLLWKMRSRPAFWTIALLAYWGYWDLTVASVLRPTQLEPFTPGLYNLMHYGRNETLAAMTILAGLFPLCIVVTLTVLRGVQLRILR